MKLVMMLLRSAWVESILAIVFSAVNAISMIGLIALIRLALNRQGESSTGLAWGFFGLCVVIILANVGSQVLLTRVSQRSVSELLMSLSRTLLRIPLRRFEALGSAKALSALTVDVNTIARTVQGIPVFCGNFLALLFGLIYLGSLSIVVMLGSIVFIGLGFCTYHFTALFGRQYVELGREAQDDLMRHMRDLVDGIKELKMHSARRRDFVERLLASANDQVRRNQTLGYSIQATATGWGRTTFFVAIGALIFVAPMTKLIPLESLTGCVLTILFLTGPLERIISFIPNVTRSNIAFKKIEAIASADDLEMSYKPMDGMTHVQTIHMEAVEYAYEMESEDRVFHAGPMNFELSPGEIVFIAGGNGSGKTTFLKLLTGLYTPTSGRIVANGIEIDDSNLEAYRNLFTVVFAEPVLFRELLGLDQYVEKEQIDSLLRHLELNDKLTVRDNSLSTIDLSKGQRKRLALLTAYLEDRPLYVFDEWAADQDPIYKRVFYDEILPSLKAKGKSVVVISHDEQYFARADRCVILDQGRIIQDKAPLATF